MHFATISVLAALMIFGCSKEKESAFQETVPNTVGELLDSELDLNRMIIETPPHLISVTSAIECVFRDPVVPRHMEGTILSKNPFSFSPSIQGEAHWVSTSRLRFVPLKHLPAGTEFKAILSGKDVFGRHRKINDFQFSFKTAEQEVIGFTGDFYPDTSGVNLMRYVGQITFAQPVKSDVIGKNLKCRTGRRTVSIELSGDPSRANVLNVTSEALERKEKGYDLVFTLPSQYRVGEDSWEHVVHLAGVNEFKILTHMDMSDPESQHLTYGLRFTDPVRANMDLSGFITVTPEQNFSVVADGKYLKIRGSFRPGERYTIAVRNGLPSALGTKLAEDFTAGFEFSNIKPAVEWLCDGIILPSSNDKKLQFKSVNVGKIRIRVDEIFADNVGYFLQRNVLSTQSGQSQRGYYDYYGSPVRYQEIERFGEEIFSQELVLGDTRNQWQTTELDLSSAFSGRRNSAFVVTLRYTMNDLVGPCVQDRNENPGDGLYYEYTNYYDSPCSHGYYNRHGTQAKLVLTSDIALTTKKTRDGVHVYAVNLLEARPASGIALSLYSFQNQLLQRAITDREGKVVFTSDKGHSVRGEGHNSLAVMRLDHPSWEVNNFDVGGATEGQQGVNVFAYTERGVHRPGDTIHLAAIVRDNRRTPEANRPVLLKVKNPASQIVHEERAVCGENGLVYFAIPTRMSDPTGNYLAEIEVGGKTVSHRLRVETVTPNRFKVDIDLSDTIVPTGGRVEGSVEARYLFGAPASDCNTRLEMRFEERAFRSNDFHDYVFRHPMVRYDQVNREIFERSLDEEGKTTFSAEIPNLGSAPELISALTTATVYEKGGSFTRQSRRSVIVPYQGFVGVKTDFSYSHATIGETYAISMVAVNSAGKAQSGHKLKMNVYVSRQHWWWDFDSRGRRDFRTDNHTYLISEQQFLSSDQPVVHKLKIEDQGLHLIEIINETTGHRTGLFFRGSRWGYGTAPGEITKTDHNTLQITSDKNVYNPGDRAVFSFPSPGHGLALVTLEQSDRILSQRVVNLTEERTAVSFDITEQMLPNCYVVVSMIQPHAAQSSDMPARLYGVMPVFVEDPATRLGLEVSAPDEIKPNEKFTVSVRSTHSQPATYTIAIVDEGLLDLTGFDTPDPWGYYYRKLRLGVITRDNFNEIMGLLMPDVNKHFSIGGDKEGERMRTGEQEVQRFRPAVLFSPPQTVRPGATQNTTFKMHNYVGSVRMMVIGTSDNSFRSVEKTIPVRQPLMVLTTVPRVARPTDSFLVPVSVFSMDEKIKSADIRISVSDNLKITGAPRQEVKFDSPGEKDISFEVAVGEAIGEGRIIVTAGSGNHSATDTVLLPINAPNPYYTEVFDTMVTTDAPVTLVPEPFGIDGTNSARIAVTRIPDLQMDKRLSYLINYPFGCLEQIVSSSFAQLNLGALTDLRPHQKQAVTNHINATINRMSNFTVSKNGFSAWPASNHFRSSYNDWVTSYAGHFLVEAQDLGYHVPQSLFDHWLSSANRQARTVNRENHRFQTYRLFVLALSGNPNMGAMNLVRESFLNELDPLSRRLLAASYHLAGNTDAANQIARQAPTEITTYREMSGTYGSSLRDQAMIVYLAVKMDDLQTAARVMRSVSKQFTSGGWYSTQENAMALLAISELYLKRPDLGGDVPFTWKVEGGKSQKMVSKGYQTVIDVKEHFGKKITFETSSANPLFLTLYTEGIPVEDIIKTERSGLEITRNFYNDDGMMITLNDIRQGAPFWIRYRVRGTTAEKISELALSSLFPSGWEIINLRLEGLEPPQWVKNFGATDGKYMDIRDDRVNWFFDLNPRAEANFAVKINPSFRGTYRLPPVSVEAMYSPEYFARLEGAEIEVK